MKQHDKNLIGPRWFKHNLLKFCTVGGAQSGVYWNKLLKIRNKLVNNSYSNHVAILPLYYINSIACIYQFDDFILHFAGD